MARKQTAREISDQVAADTLRGRSKHGPVPTHPAMAATEQNPDANATDAAQDDGDWDEDRTQ